MLALSEQKFRQSQVGVQCELASDLPDVRISADQVTQVFLNLAINAAEAIEDGGQLHVTTQLDGSGEWVDVTFADDGPGIPEDVLPHIFEPFFTTKTTGSGLGLAVSYSIIERHGGMLSVESQSGQGTTFHVRLPATKNGTKRPASVRLVDHTQREGL